jgi:chromosome segregation ATPase
MVPVEGGKTAELNVEAFHPEVSQYALTNLNSDQVEYFSQQNRITPEMRQIFQKIMAQKSKVSGFDQQITQRKQEADQISTDQARIRENMKALRGGAEEHTLLQRYTGELNSQEDKLAILRREIAEFQMQRTQANSELETMIMNINLDENL